jgi:large subunit ribosomal protein L19
MQIMISKEIINKIKPGAAVRVWEKIKEGNKERTAKFEGLVLARKHGSETGASFTVRAVITGIGVEKVYPLHSPLIDKVEILSSPKKIHRAKLYYIRDLSRRETRQKLGRKTD